MAYLLDPLEEEKNKAKATGGLNTSGVIDSSTGAAAATNGAAVDTKAPTSSGFVNLQSYLDANKGAGATMASDATKGLSAEADTYKTDAAAKAIEGQNAINAKGSQYEAAGNQIASKIVPGNYSDNWSDNATDPMEGVYGQAGQYLKSGYDAPAASSYTDPLAAQKTDLSGRLNTVDTVGGQEDLLRSTYGQNGNYTKGFGALDTFLIGSDEAGRNTINQTKGKANEVGDAYDSAAGRINSAELAAKSKMDAGKASVQGSAKTLQDNILSRGQAQANAMNASLNKSYTGASNASIGDGLTRKNQIDLAALSDLTGTTYNPADYASTYNAGKAPTPVAPPPPLAAPPTSAQDVRAGVLSLPTQGLPAPVAQPAPGSVPYLSDYFGNDDERRAGSLNIKLKK